MTPAETETPRDDDLAWLAFAYAADALAGDAALAFEARLAEDQSAREALAEAVLLAAAVGSAAAAGRRRDRRRAAGVLAAAAAVAFAAAPHLFYSAAPVPPVGVASSAPADVALTWSGLHEGGEPTPGRDDLETWLTESSPEPAPAAVETAGSADPLPHWLLEAAALPAPDAGQGS